MSSYEYYYGGEEILGIFSGLISGIPSVALAIASYVLSSLALYTIAKRRGIHNPWLAWIPMVNVWLVGSISDQYRYVVKGENKSKRKILLTLSILTAALVAAIFSCAAVAIVQTVIGNESSTIGIALAVCGLALVMIGVSIAHAVIYFMALYDVYTSMDPSNNVLFLVLSILFNVTEPFFLFFNRNKDLGMPPRRPEPTYMPPQEPWETENKDYL